MPQITLSNLSYRAPNGHDLLTDVTLGIGPGLCGLVGPNGAGKSTLLSLIAGMLRPRHGTVHVVGRLARLAQNPDPDMTLAQLFGVGAAHALLRRALAGECDATALDQVDWTLDSRIDAALGTMGLSGCPATLPLSRLSGGQRTRAGLAAVQFAKPDIVLMDEPSNNLDSDGRAALMQLLEGFSWLALVASHDRDLLQRMDHILQLRDGHLTCFTGNWTAFAADRDAVRRRAGHALDRADARVKQVREKAEQARQRKVRSTQQGLAKRRAGGQSKLVLDAMKERSQNSGQGAATLAARQLHQAEQAQRDAANAVERSRPVSARISGASTGPRRLVALEDVGVSFDPSVPILSNLSLSIWGRDRIALCGPNGAGKSTLVGLITGGLQPTTGQVQRHGTIVHLDQDTTLLDPRAPLFEALKQLDPDQSDNALRAALARLGFRGADGDRAVASLSGGERLRAGLAALAHRTTPPDLLILDEPTNHLDLDTLEALEQGLRDFPSALLVVSHDPAFLDAIGITRTIILSKPTASGHETVTKACEIRP